MRLFWLSIAVVCGCGSTSADPAKIIVDDANKVDDKKWKPYEVRLQREERVHGEVVVLSPPLFIRGPPKGFPFRVRTKRAVDSYSYGHRSYDRGLQKSDRVKKTAWSLGQLQVKPIKGTFRAKRAGTSHEKPAEYSHNPKIPRTKRSASHASGRQNRLPDQQDAYPRSPSYYQPGRVQGEVVVHSSMLSITGPPKGYPLRRKTRQAPENSQENPNSTKPLKNLTKLAVSPSTIPPSVTSKPAKRTPASSSVTLAPTKSSKSTIESQRGQGTKVKPAKGKHSMMKRLKKMWPYMLIPTMMTLGYAPFVLASIKMFVMNALMLNMMAFNAAIMLTLRNMVFGPRTGGHTKYVNYGYKPQHHHHDDRR